MCWRPLITLTVIFLLTPDPARAGLHYSAESFADLPSQWRGFLLDQRALRALAQPPQKDQPVSPLRDRYLAALAALEARGAQRSADKAADLGALYVRLGRTEQALSILRAAQREHPQHYRIIANLGTACQLQGELGQAAHWLREAVRLAPGKLQKCEELHLRLVEQRQRTRNPQELDDLFGVSFLNPMGQYEPGRLSEAQRNKLPAEAVAQAQLLALWLPQDGRLLWQLAELASANGDVRTAAAIMDGCVTEFAMSSPELRRRRHLCREASERLAATGPGHDAHTPTFRPRSRRPLLAGVDARTLPPIRPDSINLIPWSLLADTQVGREFKPRFPDYLKELDGKQIALTGFMQPIGEDLDLTGFMFIEFPVGCWFCEMPDLQSIVYVSLPANKTTRLTRGLVKVSGRLKLNTTDPEEFLYTIENARVGAAD